MLFVEIISNLFEKFIRFSLVGFSGLFVDFGVTWLFKDKIKLNKYVSNAIGFTTAATSNYILNRLWTFQSHNPEIISEYVKFYIVSIIGLTLNTAIVWIINGKRKKNFWYAKAIATACVMLWNFFANLLFTFSKLD